MLGFGALGQYTLGQVPAGTTFQLLAAAGAFLLSGQTTPLKTTFTASPGAYSLTGVATPMRVSAAIANGAFTFSGITTTLKHLFGTSPGTFTLTGRATVETTGAFTLSGAAQSFRIIEINNFASRVYNEQVGFAALGQVALGGASGVILDPSYQTSGSSLVLQVREAAAPGAFTLTGIATPNAYATNITPGVFTLTGQAATFRNTFPVLPGAYIVTGYKSTLPEQWGGRPAPSGIWTASVNDTGVTTISNAHFMFAPLGVLALGQGVYSPQIYSEGWQVKHKTTTWTPILPDVSSI